ncbi:hypothetical protein PR048_006042 [Dryococelus australis]|uniref:Integrase catalytic domain-containing protein n=1 Tax=Dryococelus australis TaxID=614101 RepID=A0ABQ9I9W2_9NEOP|nr:hypothetical protein PR048_006042 [Dryococelus australis]
MGPYPWTSTGKRFIVVVNGLFSSACARTVGKVIENEFISRWGYPLLLLTDKGTQFTGWVWWEFCNKLVVQHHTTANYHPFDNPKERRNHYGCMYEISTLRGQCSSQLRCSHCAHTLT